MKITDPNLLADGDIIYFAQAFSESNMLQNCVIHTYEVIEFPITSRPSSMANFIKLKDSTHWILINQSTNEWMNQKGISINKFEELSMQDMGIIPNKYNRHNTFWSMEDAKKYMCSVTGLTVTEPKSQRNSNYDRAMKVLDLD